MELRTDSKTPFSDLLKKRRRELKLCQSDICRILQLKGISLCEGTFSYWENGLHVPPKSKIDRLEHLATILKIKYEDILEAYTIQSDNVRKSKLLNIN